MRLQILFCTVPDIIAIYKSSSTQGESVWEKSENLKGISV